MLTNHGYLVSNFKSHPAASPRGLLYEHRKVFFEEKGKLNHACFWCNAELTWGGKGRWQLIVDHLDGEKTHNSISNLVPSCHRCNLVRGQFLKWARDHQHDPVLRAMFAAQSADGISPDLVRDQLKQRE